MGRARTKAEKTEIKLEGARLNKSFRRNSTWSEGTVTACEALANRLLGHTQGCRSEAFRTSPAVCELPASHLGDYSVSSPITYLIP